MLRCQIHGVRDVRLSECDVPAAGAGEVLVRVAAVGICGSDLHYYTEGGIGAAKIDKPMTPGHEFAGVVTGGTGLKHGLPDGTAVAVDPARPCGHCEQCRAGYENLCPNVIFLGSPGVDGGMCEYLVVPPQALHAVPGEWSPARVALLEPLGVALHALDITRLRPMATVAVLGAGPIGLLLAQVARVCGAGEVHVVEPVPYRRSAALAQGSDSASASHEEVLALTGGRGVDVVLEATNSPEGPEHAAQAVRVGGRLTLVGIPEGDRFTLSAGNARRKGLIIKMSRRMGHVYPRAIELVRSGRVNVDALATHHYPLERAPEAFGDATRMADGLIKAFVYPSGDLPARESVADR